MTARTIDFVYSAADHIKQLNDIDKDVLKLLQSAGLAVNTLTGPTTSATGKSIGIPSSVHRQRQFFVDATSQYFALLSSLDVRLRRQIYALEEAEILPAEAANRETQVAAITPPSSAAIGDQSTPPMSRQVADSKSVATGGGLGNLDIGWLNSRNDSVGKDMEAKLWDEAKLIVENF